jgi:hypothetical protein
MRDGEIALPSRKFLRPCLLWLTQNLVPIFQCLSRNNVSCFQFYITRKTLSGKPGGTHTPG